MEKKKYTTDNLLISVIVPIYNVEEYIRRCLESLKQQTLKQIEVVCIDDGSTDRSGDIADEYESDKAPIFRIIHTQNKGLSAARNRGLDEARAEWIMFVDSDDWVTERFCEIPWKVAVENQSDLVIFRAFCLKNDKVKRLEDDDKHVGVIDELTAHEFGSVVAWNKLYKKSLFDSIRYPEGRVHEDVATTHKVVHLSQKVIRIHDYLYYNTSRKGSICNTHTIANRRDANSAVAERSADLLTYGHQKWEHTDMMCSIAVEYLARHFPCSDGVYENAVKIVNSTKKIPKDLSWKQKIALITWRVDTRLFIFLSRASGRMKIDTQKDGM